MSQQFRIPFTQIHIGRFLFLLISMVLFIVLRPLLEGSIGINILMDIFISVILLSGIYAVSQKRGILIVAFIIALPMLTARWSSYFVEIPTFILIGKIFGVLFSAYIATIIVAYLFTEKEITSDMIIGAICVYFLMGLMWAFIYSVLEGFSPGSFKMAQGVINETTLSYYSYVTLTTLGYGDVTPISSPARSLAFLEAMIGQLYVAVLVARLVGVQIAQASSK